MGAQGLVGRRVVAGGRPSTQLVLARLFCQGVPLRLEVGPRELTDKTVVAVPRHTSQKRAYSAENLNATVHQLLQSIQLDLFDQSVASHIWFFLCCCWC